MTGVHSAKPERDATLESNAKAVAEEAYEQEKEVEDKRTIYQEMEFYGARPKTYFVKKKKDKDKKKKKKERRRAFKDAHDGYVTDNDEEWSLDSYPSFRAQGLLAPADRANAVWDLRVVDKKNDITEEQAKEDDESFHNPPPPPPPYVRPPPYPRPSDMLPLFDFPPLPPPAIMVIETPETPVAYGKIASLCIDWCCPMHAAEKNAKWKFE